MKAMQTFGDKALAAQFSMNFLPSSQSFIYQELINHRRYRMEAFALGRMNENVYPFDKVHTLLPTKHPLKLADAGLFAGLGLNLRFQKHFATKPFKLIHAQFGPAARLATPFKRFWNLPLICTFGGIDVQSLFSKPLEMPDYWLYKLTKPLTFAHIDRFLAVSQDLADKLIRLGADEKKVFVFRRGVFCPKTIREKNADRANTPIILMAGRLVEKKGFAFAIRALGKLKKEGLSFQVRLLGEGPLLEDLQTIAKEAALSERIAFEGHVEQSALFAAMEEADILCVPSVTSQKGDTEGIPNVLKEGYARALPAAVTRHGGIPEITDDGVTGFISEERDIDALANHLRILITEDTRRLEMGIAARAKMLNEFDMPKRIERLERHYDEVIAAHRSL